MLLNPHPSRAERDLPIDFYESIREMAGDQQKTLFIESSYTLASEEAERIGVDHVSGATNNNSKVNTDQTDLHTKAHLFPAIPAEHSRASFVCCTSIPSNPRRTLCLFLRVLCSALAIGVCSQQSVHIY